MRSVSMLGIAFQRVSGKYLIFNRLRFFDEVSAGHVNPCFLKLRDRTITNTRFSYDMFEETKMELFMNSIIFQQEPLLPGPLEYDDEYYQYHLLRELVEKLWEGDSKAITLMVPQECNGFEAVKAYLQSWIDDHNIDAWCDFKMV